MKLFCNYIRKEHNISIKSKFKPNELTYSLVLHWHQIRIASICGDIILMPELEARTMPSSRATPAWVAMPPRFEFLEWDPDVRAALGATCLVNQVNTPNDGVTLQLALW